MSDALSSPIVRVGIILAVIITAAVIIKISCRFIPTSGFWSSSKKSMHSSEEKATTKMDERMDKVDLEGQSGSESVDGMGMGASSSSASSTYISSMYDSPSQKLDLQYFTDMEELGQPGYYCTNFDGGTRSAASGDGSTIAMSRSRDGSWAGSSGRPGRHGSHATGGHSGATPTSLANKFESPSARFSFFQNIMQGAGGGQEGEDPHRTNRRTKHGVPATDSRDSSSISDITWSVAESEASNEQQIVVTSPTLDDDGHQVVWMAAVRKVDSGTIVTNEALERGNKPPKKYKGATGGKHGLQSPVDFAHIKMDAKAGRAKGKKKRGAYDTGSFAM